MSAAELVNKVWNYSHVLRDDGVGYGDYVEEKAGVPLHQSSPKHPHTSQVPSPQSSPRGRGGGGVPKEYAWARLVGLDGGAGQYFKYTEHES